MRRWTKPLLAALMFCAPFVLLAMSYRAAPAEMPLLRFGIGHTTLWGAKSLFTVFRVPLINLIHGLMAAVMLSLAPAFQNVERRTSYANLFSTLLFTIALKSDFEGLEFFAATSPILHPLERWLGVGTLACVVVGLATALILGRKVPIPWPELQLTTRDKLSLCGLFALYLAIVIATFAIGHRA